MALYSELSLEKIGNLYSDYLRGVEDGSIWYNFGTFVQRNTIINCSYDGVLLNKMSDGEVLYELRKNYNNVIGSDNNYNFNNNGRVEDNYYDNDDNDDDKNNEYYEENGSQLSRFGYFIIIILFFIFVVLYVH